MRLTAYTIEGASDVWDTWEGVEGWMLSGSKLIMRVREAGRPVLRTVDLPSHVVGLADDNPTRVVVTSESRPTGYRPASRDRQPDLAPATEGRLRIPDREPPRGRFGDSPRRRQFKGDGS